jgi:hypothetical protein
LVSDGKDPDIDLAGGVSRAGCDTAGLKGHKVTVRKGDC